MFQMQMLRSVEIAMWHLFIQLFGQDEGTCAITQGRCDQMSLSGLNSLHSSESDNVKDIISRKCHSKNRTHFLCDPEWDIREKLFSDCFKAVMFSNKKMHQQIHGINAVISWIRFRATELEFTQCITQRLHFVVDGGRCQGGLVSKIVM